MTTCTDYLRAQGYGHVYGHISDADVKAFRSIVKRMPAHFRMVELGSFQGASAVTFALLAKEMNKTCEILCIDILFTDADWLEIFKENTKDFDNIHYRAELFHSGFKYDDGLIDLYFDDASHDERPTYRQLMFWSKYATNIAVHDYHEVWSGTIKAVDAFSAELGLNVEHFDDSTVVYMENIRGEG